MSLAPGTRIGPYEVTAPLGAGGMGEVWRARDPRLGRDVAIKSLPEAFANDPERLSRFEREAKLLASLSHPNIAGIHGLEESGGNRYLILEFVEGETLEDRLKRGPLPVDDTLEIGAQIALALETAHESGVVHRDLKPGNVMLTPEGAAKVLDFGLAKGADGGSSDANLSASPTLTHHATEAGVILGTAAYMSPEQARGRRVDRRTDIWSFGCVLYECLTGKQTFEGETVSDLIAKILEREPDWDALPERTPPRVRALLRRCLTKDPSVRLRDIGEARIALAGGDAVGEDGATTDSARRSPRRIPWQWILTLLVVAAAAVLMNLLPRGTTAPEPLWLSVVTPEGARLDAGPEFNVLAVAPDGKSIAYVARREGTHRLYLRRLDDRSVTVLPGTEDARDPFFSPDGEWVGFFAGRTLRKVSVRGGSPVDLAEVAADRGGTWAEDGTIVFTPSFGSPLVRIPDSGGATEPLTSLDTTQAERSHRWPAAIPGSEWVLFTVGTMNSPGSYDDADIDAVSLRTGERRRVGQGSYARCVAGGPLLVGRSGSVFAMRLDPDTPERVGSGTPVLDGVLGEPTSGATFFDVARNGLLAYVPGRADRDHSLLAWVDVAGRMTRLPVEVAAYKKISLSPDGDRALVEIGPGSGASSDVWLLDLEKPTMSRITFGEADASPLWMPDGRRFVWASTRIEGQEIVESILLRSIDGADTARTVTRHTGLITITGVTPDGAEILYSEYGKVDSEVWSVPVDGSRAPRVEAGGPLAQTNGTVSPDGLWLAYISDETGQGEIYLQPWRRPGTRSQVTRDGGRLPLWTSDSRTLYFVSHGSMFRAALSPQGDALRAETPERLFDIDVNSDSSYQDVDLHRSGEKFLVRIGEGENERREVAIVPGWAATLEER